MTEASENDFKVWMTETARHFEWYADSTLPKPGREPRRLIGAMRYAVLGGGKRVRALLAYAAGAVSGASPEALDRAALARDFTQAVVDELVPRAMLAMQQSGRKVLVAAGGVAANSFIRAELEKECRKHGYRLYMPPLKLCGDNGAMIGAQGYYEYLAGARADWALNAYATRDIDDPIV